MPGVPACWSPTRPPLSGAAVQFLQPAGADFVIRLGDVYAGPRWPELILQVPRLVQPLTPEKGRRGTRPLRIALCITSPDQDIVLHFAVAPGRRP